MCAGYLACPCDLVWKSRVEMRLKEAAAGSLCGLTAAQALFFRMGLRAPFDWLEKSAMNAGLDELASKTAASLSFFIYEVSTSVGLYAA